MPETTETRSNPETAAPEQLTLEQTPEPKLADTSDLFAKASEVLEEEPEKETPATVEEELEIVDGKEPEPKAETAPEPEPEPEKEPKKSKRELFKEKAEADKAHRDKESKLKEREAKLEAELKELNALKRQLDEDPIAYLEKKNPKLYEEWTERNLAGNRKESAELTALKAEVAELKKTQEEKLSAVEKSAIDAQNTQYLNEAKSLLMSKDFETAREDAEIWEHFTGQPVNIDRAIAERHDEFLTMYGKKLTPAECCEIINEDAQAHLEKIGSFIEYIATKKPDIFKQSKTVSQLFGQTPAKESPKTAAPPQTTGKTLTNEQETQSVSAGEIDPSKYPTKQAYLDAVAKATLEYGE
jgi:hypothetical protein